MDIAIFLAITLYIKINVRFLFRKYVFLCVCVIQRVQFSYLLQYVGGNVQGIGQVGHTQLSFSPLSLFSLKQNDTFCSLSNVKGLS